MVVMDFASKVFNRPFRIQCERLKVYPVMNLKSEIAELDGGVSSDEEFIVVETKINARVS